MHELIANTVKLLLADTPIRIPRCCTKNKVENGMSSALKRLSE